MSDSLTDLLVIKLGLLRGSSFCLDATRRQGQPIITRRRHGGARAKIGHADYPSVDALRVFR